MGGVVANILTGGLLDGISKVIDSIRGKSPADAAKLEELKTTYQSDILKVQADLAKAQIQANSDLNATAGANIRAESQSRNWLVQLARPSVIWMGNFLLLWNYGAVPMVGIKYHILPVTLPDMFWWTWGTVVTGYVFARTAQEIGGKVLGGSGGSAQLPFGIKLDSKGD